MRRRRVRRGAAGRACRGEVDAAGAGRRVRGEPADHQGVGGRGPAAVDRDDLAAGEGAARRRHVPRPGGDRERLRQAAGPSLRDFSRWPHSAREQVRAELLAEAGGGMPVTDADDSMGALVLAMLSVPEPSYSSSCSASRALRRSAC